MNKPHFSYLPVLAIACLAMTACQRDSSDAAITESSSGAGAVVVSSLASVSTSCSGIAPTGELIAERIPAANNLRTEPGLYEGPVWIGDALYFSDFIFTQGFSSRIQKLDSSGAVTLFIDDAGSNGLAVDTQGNLVAATHKYKAVSRYSLATKEHAPVAGQYNGNVFNSPNDLTVAKDGTIYFTDPAFQRDAAPGGQEKTGVYRIAVDGTVTLVDDTISNPNGISLSPNQDVLYVNGGGDQGIVRAYPLVNGIPQAGKDLITGISVPDGMTVDCSGNLYVTEHLAQQTRVFTPTGAQLAVIKSDANVTNAAFGGPEGKTLYLTGAGSIWKVELQITGSAY